MKFPGRVYNTKEGTFVAVYNFFPDIYVKAPQSIRKKSDHVAHVQYSEGAKRKAIDVFRYQGNITCHPVRKDGKTVWRSERHPEIYFAEPIERTDARRLASVDVRQDVEYDLVSLPASSEPGLLSAIRKDINLYCKRPAKDPQGTRINHQKLLVPKTTMRRIRQNRLLEPGKQEFVPSCVLEANLDFSQGCISGWVPGQNGVQAGFDGTTFTNYFLDPDGECGYCYAMANHESFPKNTYYPTDPKRLEAELRGDAQLEFGTDEKYGKLVKVLRFGKRTEAGSDFTLDSLATSLEVCARTGTRTVLPTKFLRFNPGIADLLKRTNSQLLYSIGFDEFERGPVTHGCTNEWRLEQAVKYGEAGVNSNLYLLVASAVSHPTLRDIQILEFAHSNRKAIRGVQVLPARYTSKDLCEQMSGRRWDFLKQQTQIMPGTGGKVKIYHPREQGSFEPIEGKECMGTCFTESGVLIPNKIHPAWLELVGDNKGQIRMCHHNLQTTWCGSCSIGPGFITETIHTEKKKIPKARERKEMDRKLPLFEEDKPEKPKKK